MDIQLQSDDYNVDFVMCIDGTASMAPIINEVKKNALTFLQKYVEIMEENDKEINELRIKVIVFRDYACDEKPMEESKFFTLPDEADKLKAFVDGIEAKGGGDTPENALEAIALALKSDWTPGYFRRRHTIIVVTDAPALPLGMRADSPNYPLDMPRDLDELTAWWEGTDRVPGGTYHPRAGRLVVFAPKVYPWVDMLVWNRNWTVFPSEDKNRLDLDIQSAIDVLVGPI